MHRESRPPPGMQPPVPGPLALLDTTGEPAPASWQCPGTAVGCSPGPGSRAGSAAPSCSPTAAPLGPFVLTRVVSLHASLTPCLPVCYHRHRPHLPCLSSDISRPCFKGWWLHPVVWAQLCSKPPHPSAPQAPGTPGSLARADAASSWARMMRCVFLKGLREDFERNREASFPA